LMTNRLPSAVVSVVQETPSPTCKERLISDISGDIGIRESGGLGCMA